MVLDGRAGAIIGDAHGDAVAGDSFVVPPDTMFEVSNAGNVGLRMLCCLPVGGQALTDSATFTPPWAE